MMSNRNVPERELAHIAQHPTAGPGLVPAGHGIAQCMHRACIVAAPQACNACMHAMARWAWRLYLIPNQHRKTHTRAGKCIMATEILPRCTPRFRFRGVWWGFVSIILGRRQLASRTQYKAVGQASIVMMMHSPQAASPCSRFNTQFACRMARTRHTPAAQITAEKALQLPRAHASCMPPERQANAG